MSVNYDEIRDGIKAAIAIWMTEAEPALKRLPNTQAFLTRFHDPLLVALRELDQLPLSPEHGDRLLLVQKSKILCDFSSSVGVEIEKLKQGIRTKNETDTDTRQNIQFLLTLTPLMSKISRILNKGFASMTQPLSPQRTAVTSNQGATLTPPPKYTAVTSNQGATFTPPPQRAAVTPHAVIAPKDRITFFTRNKRHEAFMETTSHDLEGFVKWLKEFYCNQYLLSDYKKNASTRTKRQDILTHLTNYPPQEYQSIQVYLMSKPDGCTKSLADLIAENRKPKRAKETWGLKQIIETFKFDSDWANTLSSDEFGTL